MTAAGEMLATAVRRVVEARHRAGAFGFVLSGLPPLDQSHLFTDLGGPGKVFVTLVGGDTDSSMAWARQAGWDELGFGVGGQHAVEVRNKAPEGAIRLAIVDQDEERLHSLTRRGYVPIGPSEVIADLCHEAASLAPNQPQRHLWQALGSGRLAPYLTAEGLLTYYQGVVLDSSADPLAAPRALLPRLGLLPDRQLLTARYASLGEVTDRLLANVRMVERLQRADPEDRQRAAQVVQTASPLERSILVQQYHAFLRIARNELAALGELDLSDADRLFGPVRRAAQSEPEPEPGDPEEPEPPDEPEEPFPRDRTRTFRNLAEAAIYLTVQAEPAVLAELVRKASARLEDGDTQPERLIEGRYVVPFRPDERAVALTRAAVGSELFGGTISSDEYGVLALLAELSRHVERIEQFDGIRRTALEHLLEVARERLVDTFEGAELLRAYLERRAALLPFAPLLAASPLACLVAQPEALTAAQQTVAAYEQLLGHLETSYLALRRRSAAGTEQMYREILALDLVRVEGADEVLALLTPLHPLVLWKYVELASVVLSRGSELAPADHRLLAEEVADLPEPLLALYCPGQNGAVGRELGYAGRVGSLPYFLPVSEVPADVGEQTLRLAGEKLAALYPPVREEARLTLVNPETTEHASRAIKALRRQKQFKRAHIVIARTHGDRRPLPADPTMDELFAQEAVTLEEFSGTLDDVAEELTRRPAHLLAVAGTQRRNVVLIESAGTLLHPLSLPQQLDADRLLGIVSLRPRSVQSADGGISHPFGVYQTLISDLLGNARSEYSLQSARPLALEECLPLVPRCQFLLVTGDAPGFTPDQALLRLTQGVGLTGDAVFTSHQDRILGGLAALLEHMNYKPTEERLRVLVGRLQEIGGEGLFATISDKSPNGFSASALRGQLGLAVALDWLADETAGQPRVTLSLDSHLARTWLDRREERERSDLLVFGETADGKPVIDIIEVKSYEATDDLTAAESHPAQQLRSVARVIRDMLDRTGDLLIDRRRELLRLQVYREGLLPQTSHDPDWIQRLNDVIDGSVPDVQLNLTLIELAFGQNIPLQHTVIPPASEATNPVERLPVTRLRFGEADIQRHLHGIVDRPSDAGEAVLSMPEPPLHPPEGTGGLSVLEPTSVQPSMAAGELVGKQTAASTQDALLGFEPDEGEVTWIQNTAKHIYSILREIRVQVAGQVDPQLVDVGPSVVRFKVRLQPGERLAALESRSRDLMRELALPTDPIIDNLPGTNFVSIDLPRPRPRPAPLRHVLERMARAPGYGLVCPVGVTPSGEVEMLDLTMLPHMLVAGSTGSGKTMFLYSLVVGLTRFYGPDELSLVLVDPKQTDFVFFQRLPHLRGSDIITDPREAIQELKDLLSHELERRTELLRTAYARDLQSFNSRHPDAPVAPIVVVIDEFADLADVMAKAEREDFDLSLRRLAQRARNVGIHLVIATQRPTTDIVNGNLKSNLPCRVSFRLASQIDSRTILDRGGAEHLLGRGDMLLLRDNLLRRLQGFLLAEDDIFALLGVQPG